MIRENMLRAWALELGFGQMELCSAANFADEQRAVQAQPPLAERKQLRFFPEKDAPQTRSLAVLLWPYAPEAIRGGDSVFVDGYYPASHAAYHAARTLEARVLEAGGFAKANVPYPAREAAVRAGLGVIGKNGLLITPQWGTRVVIILMATDLPAPLDAGVQTGNCMDCGRCQRACPVGAIDAGGMTHPERCLRNAMMEGIVVPPEQRERMGMRLIGCDICQRVCPMQIRGSSACSMDFHLDDFMTEDEQAFSRSVAHLAECIGRNAARPQRVRAQAALLAGNRKAPADLPVLRLWAQLPFEAVQAHARWAIARIEESDEAQGDAGLTERTKPDTMNRTV